MTGILKRSSRLAHGGPNAVIDIVRSTHGLTTSPLFSWPKRGEMDSDRLCRPFEKVLPIKWRLFAGLGCSHTERREPIGV